MSCPSADRLQALLTQQLSAADALLLEKHIDGCPDCQALLARLTEDEQTAEWRRLLADASQVADAEPDGVFLRRLKGNTLFHEAIAGADPVTIQFPGAPTAKGPLGQLGQYHMMRELGAGGTGVVYQAHDETTGGLVAIKVLRPELAASPGGRARFEREVRAAAKVRHDHVVRIYHVGNTEGFFLPYTVMEFVEGEALSHRLRREKRLPAPEAAELTRQVALGLAYAHAKGLVHRDVKPSNILLDAVVGRAKLADFGLARAVEGTADELHQRLTQTGNIVGTPAYMSPEQVQTPLQVDGRSDLYGLGMVLYQMLTGAVPFHGATTPQILMQVVTDDPPPPRRLNPLVPADLETICLKCLEKDPAARYATVDDLAEDLRRYLTGEPIKARAVRAWERAAKWARRNPRVAVPSGLFVAAVVVGLAVTLWFNIRLRDSNTDLESSKQDLEHVNLSLASALQDVQNNRGELQKTNVRLEEALGEARRERDQSQTVAELEGIRETARLLRDGRTTELDEALSRVPHSRRGWEWHRLQFERSLRRPPEEIGSHDWAVSDFILSADRQRLVSSGLDGRVICWDLKAGTSRELERGIWSEDIRIWMPALIGPDQKDPLRPADCIQRLCWARDGVRVAGASLHGKGIIWNINGGPGEVILSHSRPLNAVAAWPGGEQLLFGDDGGKLFYRDLRQESRRELALGRNPVMAIVALPSEGWVIAQADGMMSIVDIKAMRVVRTWRERGPIWGLDRSEDGGTVAVAGAQLLLYSVDRLTHRWYVTARHAVPEFESRSLGAFHAARLSADGKTVVASDEVGRALIATERDPGLRMVQSESLSGALLDTDVRQLPLPLRRRLAVCVGPEPDTAITAGLRPVLQKWFVTQENGVTILATGRQPKIAFDPVDPRLLWVADESGALSIWDSVQSRNIGSAHAHDGAVTGLALTAAGLAVTCGTDQRVRFWKRSGEELVAARAPIPHDQPLRSVAVTRDGSRVAAYDREDQVLLWEVSSGRRCACVPLRKKPNETALVGPLAFNADGTVLAVAGPSQSFRLLSGPNLETVQNTPDIIAGDGGTAIVWHPKDSQRLIAGDSQGRIAGIGANLLTGFSPRSPVAGLAFTPDGARAAAVLKDGTIQMLDLDWLGSLATFSTKHRSEDPATAPIALAFDGAGARLAIAHRDGVIEIWETAGGLPPAPTAARQEWRQTIFDHVQKTRPHMFSTPAVDFDPEGRLCLLCLRRELRSGDSDKQPRPTRLIFQQEREGQLTTEVVTDLGDMDDRALGGAGRSVALLVRDNMCLAAVRRPRTDKNNYVGQIELFRRPIAGGPWQSEPVGELGNWGFDAHLIPDQPGKPLILHFSHGNSYLIATTWGPGGWTSQAVGHRGDGYSHVARKGPDGRLHVGFATFRHDNDQGGLIYLGLDGSDLGREVRETLSKMRGKPLNLALTPDGQPVMLYQRSKAGVQSENVLARRTAAGWRELATFSGLGGKESASMTCDRQGIYRIVFWEPISRQIRLITGTENDWRTELVWEAGAADLADAAASESVRILHFLDPQDRPVILLYLFGLDLGNLRVLRPAQ